MAEIDDNTLAQLANIDAFVRRGLSNPKTRRKILEVQKELNPQTAIPELDESDPLRQEIRELREEWQKEREERDQRQNLGELTTKWQAGQAAARRRGFTDESLEKLEKFMEEKQIVNHEVAIPAYQELNPPPRPAVSSATRWDFFGPQADDGPDLKLLYEGKDEQWLDTAITDTLNKVRSGEITR